MCGPMKAQPGRCIRFGVFEFNPEVEELRRRGLKVKLGPLACRALSLLLEHPGKLYTREEVRAHLWPDNVFVDFEHSLNKTIHMLRMALDDSPTNPRYIETVAGRGYRFIPAMRPANETVGAGGLRKVDSVAVLPFATTGDDRECNFLAGQITVQLTNSLARLPGVRVLAHNTVKHCSALGRSPQEVGRALGVRAVLFAELLCSSGDSLINAELIDVANGAQLWGGQIAPLHRQDRDCSEYAVGRILRQLQPILAIHPAKSPLTPKKGCVEVRVIPPISAKKALSFFPM
jgi:DNA-binding winged helix-turn-helix (wHTH) protein